MQEGVLSQSYRSFGKGARTGYLDLINPGCILLLGIISVFFIHSAQAYNGGTQWKMQIVWLILGGGVYVMVSWLNYKILFEKAHLIYILCILALIPLAVEAVLRDLNLGISLPLVRTRYGATRWLDLKILQVQPSELAKVGTLILGASVLSRSLVGSIRESLEALGKVTLVFGIPMLLIFLQPDLGSTLVFPPMIFALLYASRLSLRFFVTSSVLFVTAVSIVSIDCYRYYNYRFAEDAPALVEGAQRYEERSWLPLRDYQRNRILGFIIPEVIDPRGINETYNQMQSKITVGSGGFFGKGLGNGTQAKTGYLPSSVAHNDFIFSVIAEETGFIGASFILSIFLLMIANTIRIAVLARDRFGMLLAVGVAVLLLVHVFINVGMTMGLTPITGLPLPFLSYGGTFVLSCCLLMGMVQSVYRFHRDFS
ncbi:MAG: FtsW/RodA/SpoVE family cell cycle protein [Puniceicoccaceae bacterium]